MYPLIIKLDSMNFFDSSKTRLVLETHSAKL